jgi:two-component system sensor histidine kinase UhpB
MSLRSSINWLISLVMVLFIISLGVLQIMDSSRSAAAEMQAGTRVTVQLLTSLINNEKLQHGMVTPAGIATYLDRTGRIRAHDIEVLDAQGKVLHQSPPSPWKAGRNAPAWFTHLVAPPVSSITLPVGDGELHIKPDTSRMVLDAWDELLQLFWLSLVLFTLLNLLIFWFASRALKENNAWLQLIQRHVEDERRTLAHELHDEIGQSLTAIKTIATTLASRTRDKLPELHDAARMIVDVSGQLYDAMHGLVRRLRPLVLDKLGLQAALQELVDSQRERHPQLLIALTTHGDLSRVSPEVAIVAYRMVQESLTNVVRHAAATEAQVRVEVHDKLLLIVRDNGHGPRESPTTLSEGFGLLGMRERAESLGGSFHWQNDVGVRVVVSLPLRGQGKAA